MHVLGVPLEDEDPSVLLVVDRPPLLGRVPTPVEREAGNVSEGPDPDGVVVGAGGEERAAGGELDDVDFVAVAFKAVHGRDAGDVEDWEGKEARGE